MALRIEKTACLILLGLAIASGEDLVFTARHRHPHKGGPGSLSFTETGVRWEETKKRDHCFDWKYSDLQRLELWPDHVHIVTYDDISWQFGRDREYDFDKLPPDLATRVYPLLITRLDQRFQAFVAEPGVTALYETPAKRLLARNRGSNGVLKIGMDRIVFDANGQGESRTWRFSDISTVSSAGPFDLDVRHNRGRKPPPLKQALPEDRYNEIWRRITESNGLRLYGGQEAHEHAVR